MAHILFLLDNSPVEGSLSVCGFAMFVWLVEEERTSSTRMSVDVRLKVNRERGPRSLSVRYYEKSMPNLGDLVMVKVTKISDTSAYVQLLEYENIEGMIPYTEISRRRIRSIAKFVRVGKLDVATVIRLDSAKGYIDLSKKQVTEEEHQRCLERYQKAKKVHSIIASCADETGVALPQLMEKIAWPLYRDYPHAYDALKLANTDERGKEKVLAPLQLQQNVLDSLLKIMSQKLKDQTYRIEVNLDITCFGSEGVDAIKKALQLAKHQSAPSMPITVHIVVPQTMTSACCPKAKNGGWRRCTRWCSRCKR